jgi:hypothetical protein
MDLGALSPSAVLPHSLAPQETEFPALSNDGTQWSLTQEIVPPDGAGQDLFGDTVALSGHTVLIGAPEQGAVGAGAAYVYAGPVPNAPALGNRAPLLGLILVLAGVATLISRRRRQRT